MSYKLLLICLIALIGHPQSDLSRFLAASNKKIIKVTSIQSVAEQLRNQTITECPGIIVAVFSPGGKLLSINEMQQYEITRLKSFSSRGMFILCVSIQNTVFVYNQTRMKRIV